MRIAVHQGGAAGPGDALARADALAAAAAARGAELLVLPQLFLDHPRGELSDGPAARALAASARARGVAILCGYAESCTGRLHDAALLVDARGCALANYRRVHLVPETDEPRFAPGAWLNVAVLAGRRVGILIGADVEGPETARALALAGAEILLVLGRSRAGDGRLLDAILPARAAENRCGLAFANGECRLAGAPAARLLAPDGAELALAEAPAGLAVASVPVAARADRHRRDVLRRPRLYQRLVAPMPDEGGPRL